MPTTINGVPVHPAAEIFPMMSAKEKADLVEDIRANGVRSRIELLGETLEDAVLLDGRNRMEAMEVLGIAFDAHYKLTSPDDVPDPVGYVLSLNLHRRHLSESQRAMVAESIATLKNGERRCEKGGSIDPPFRDTSIPEAAAALNVSPASVKRARKVKAKGSDELNAAVVDGTMSVSKAAAIAGRSKEQQAAAVTEAKKPKPPRPKKPPKQKRAAKVDEVDSEPEELSQPLMALKELFDSVTHEQSKLIEQFANWVRGEKDIDVIHMGCDLWTEWK